VTPAERETWLRTLRRMTKRELIMAYRPYCLASAHPLSTWSKDELIAALLEVLPAPVAPPGGAR